MKKIFSTALLVFFICEIAASQPEEEWVKRFNGSANSYDIASEMLIDKNNNIIVCGTGRQTGTLLDFIIIKYGQDGNIIWTNTFDGGANSFDQLNSACIDNSGNCIATGYTTNSGFETKFTTIKVDTSGEISWFRIFDVPGFTDGNGKDISVDNDGNITACGVIKDSTGYFDIAIVKYSAEGNFIWSQIFNGEGNGNDIPVAVNIDNENNILIAGTTKTQTTNADLIVLKYLSSGSALWSKTFNGNANSDDEMASMITDNNNNIYFCGSVYNTSGAFDFFFAKLNNLGATQWSHTFNGSGNNLDIASSITLDNKNNVYITGSSRNDTILGSEDIATIKVSSDGEFHWLKIFNGESGGTDQGNSVVCDEHGDVYVGGASDMGNFHMIYALLKYDSTGSFLWKKNYYYSNFPEDFIYSVRLDKFNNIFVNGIGFDIASDFDIVTIKYSQTVGISENSQIPDQNFLSQNYPNPFNPRTIINYQCAMFNFVSLKVYDVLGNEVAVLVNESKSAGSHSVEFDGSAYPSGIYFYTLRTGDFFQAKRMSMIK